jgi:ABC-type oligopeptide transport system ATPase subunit
LLVCDEPVSALDVSVRAQIINLLLDLQEERGLAMLFIAHDLPLVQVIAHDVIVMRHGKLVEAGSALKIFHDPQEEYTQELLASIPGKRHRRLPASSPNVG